MIQMIKNLKRLIIVYQEDVVDNGKEDTPSEESKFKDKFGGFKFNQ